MRVRLIIPLLLPMLAGCAALRAPEQNAAELAALRPAADCDATLPFFGHYRPIGERIPMYAEPDGRISMRNDGGWCAIRYQVILNYFPTTGQGHVLQPPAHGRAIVGTLNGLLHIAYRPEPGYSGGDFFTVRMTNPEPDTIPVRVTVRP